MKKTMLSALLIFVALATFPLEAQTNTNLPAVKTITLVSPRDNTSLNRVPAQINFKWLPVEGVTQYSLLIQIKDGTKWKNHLTRRNLTGNTVTVTYDKTKDFRWLVGSMGAQGQVIKSLFWKVHYRGEVNTNDSTHRNM